MDIRCDCLDCKSSDILGKFISVSEDTSFIVCPNCNSESVTVSIKIPSDAVEIKADSGICDYCQRKQFPDKDYDDGKCYLCMHSPLHRACSTWEVTHFFKNNFLGVECTARRTKE